MNIVPNRSRMTQPSGRSSGGGFIGKLLGVVGAQFNAQSELAMHQAKTDIDTAAHLERTSHKFVADTLLTETRGKQDRKTMKREAKIGQKQTDYSIKQAGKLVNQGFDVESIDPKTGKVVFQASGLAGRVKSEEDTGAQMPEKPEVPHLFRHTPGEGPGSTPSWRDTMEAVNNGAISMEEGIALSSEYEKRAKASLPAHLGVSKLEHGQFEQFVKEQDAGFKSNVEMKPWTEVDTTPTPPKPPKPGPTPPAQSTGQM